MAQILIVLTMAGYLLMMLTVGIMSSRRRTSSSQGDFFLGGRKIGPLVTAMSAEASDMSSYLLMGLPGLAFISGLSDVGWTAIGLALGTYLNWRIVSGRLRRWSERLDAITIPDLLSKRYHDKKNILSSIAAVIILIFFVPYTASGFKAIGTLFNTLFGVDYHAAMIVGAIFIVIYTAVGGFFAVATNDLIQSIVMSFALVAILIFGVYVAGGPSSVVESTSSLPGYLSMTEIYDVASGSSSPYGTITVLSTMAWGLGYFGMPHILVRFMAIRRESELVMSRRIASVWVAISMSVAIVLGVVGMAIARRGGMPLFTTSADSETVIIQLAHMLSENGAIAAIIAGLTMSGILACTMSTADSQLLQASSSFSKNILQDLLGVRLNDRKALIAARSSVIAVAIIAVILAWDPQSSIFYVVSFAWAGLGAAFGPLVLLSLFWRRTTFRGALSGMIAGGAMVFIWKFFVRPLGGAWNVYELLPAFITSAAVIVIVSLLDPPPSDAIARDFDRCAAR